MTSAPVASHTFAISLMNEIRVTSAAFAASLIISAEATSQRTTGAVDPLVQLRDDVAVGDVERADDDPVGMHEVVDGRSLGRELGVRDVADVVEAAIVEPVPHAAARADGHGALHRDDDPPVDLRAARRRPSRRRRDPRRPSTSAACPRRCRRRPRRRPPRATSVVKSSRSRVRVEKLVEPVLVDRHARRRGARRSSPRRRRARRPRGRARRSTRR